MTDLGGRDVTWDTNGNLIGKGGVTYKYDSSSRLTSVVSGTVVATFEYSPDGLRTSMTVNGVRTSYLWDTNASLPVILTDTDSIYIYGLSLIARQTGETVEYYHSDALGSVRSLTNGSGQSVGAYSYRPFGEGFSASGSSTNPFQYTGQLDDQQSGLYYLRARYYQPETGRFITRDPFSGYPSQPQTLNMYAYVHGNPLLYTDPAGYDAWWEELAKRLETYSKSWNELEWQFATETWEGGTEAGTEALGTVRDLGGFAWRVVTMSVDEEELREAGSLAVYIAQHSKEFPLLVAQAEMAPYMEALECRQYGKIFGRGGVEFALMLAGTKGVTRLAMLADAARAARAAGRTQRAIDFVAREAHWFRPDKVEFWDKLIGQGGTYEQRLARAQEFTKRLVMSSEGIEMEDLGNGYRAVKYNYNLGSEVFEFRFRELPDGTLELNTVVLNPTR